MLEYSPRYGALSECYRHGFYAIISSMGISEISGSSGGSISHNKPSDPAETPSTQRRLTNQTEERKAIKDVLDISAEGTALGLELELNQGKVSLEDLINNPLLHQYVGYFSTALQAIIEEEKRKRSKK